MDQTPKSRVQTVYTPLGNKTVSENLGKVNLNKKKHKETSDNNVREETSGVKKGNPMPLIGTGNFIDVRESDVSSDSGFVNATLMVEKVIETQVT